MSDSGKLVQKRQFFRLEYPSLHRPSLIMDIDKYEIKDISEFGLKFRIEDDISFMVDDLIIATIMFPDGEEYELSGQIIRTENYFASMQLAEPIPLSKIRAEHLFLISNYEELSRSS